MILDDFLADYKIWGFMIRISLYGCCIEMTVEQWIRLIWIGARPKTIAAALVPVWLGGVMAWELSGEFHVALWVCTLLGAICIQIATNFFNDALDGIKGADSRMRTGPQRLTGSGELSPGQVMSVGGMFLLGAVVFGAVLVMERGWIMLAIGLPSLFLSYGYTGGPFPLAYRGLGEVFVILFFGFVAVMGTIFVQTGGLAAEGVLLGAQVGLLSAVLISVNNLRDRREDLLVDKKTLAVRFGPKVAVAVIWLEIKIAAFLGIAWLGTDYPIFSLASAPMFMIGMRIIWGVMSLSPGEGFNRLLAMGALQMIMFAAIFHILAMIF
ncbi:MAG: 1,4-dihydroxy-2-naphthoate octaprenyltransferase [Verrucomicrobiota bacterium]|jgi:1,4-dihydroxy-2-naphthoate octaprenyltransferase